MMVMTVMKMMMMMVYVKMMRPDFCCQAVLWEKLQILTSNSKIKTVNYSIVNC